MIQKNGFKILVWRSSVMEKIRVQIAFNDEQYQKIKAEADKQALPVSSYIRSIVFQFLNKKDK